MARRMFLFFLTNLGVILTISIVTQLLGIDGYLNAQGINYTVLLVFCSLWGIGGAFVALAMSKRSAKWMMKVQTIEGDQAPSEYRELVATVHRLSKAAGLEKMPEVGIYPSQEVNAFATGPSKNNALVAVSMGLLQRMNRSEVEGVLGHEVAHIANGDMVTMTLIQGVVNAFTMFLARIAAFALSAAMGDEDEGPSFLMELGLVFLFDMVFTVLGSVVVNYFSRQREYRADAGGAHVAGRGQMIAALEKLRAASGMVEDQNQAIASLKINGKPRGMARFFMSHPPIEDRIRTLREMRGPAVSYAS